MKPRHASPVSRGGSGKCATLWRAGLLNKQIASELGTGEKVVKVHRSRAMRKLEIDSVAALVRLLLKLPPDKPAHP